MYVYIIYVYMLSSIYGPPDHWITQALVPMYGFSHCGEVKFKRWTLTLSRLQKRSSFVLV